MSYADPERQKAYAREWIKNRRDAWFKENGPCIDCGSWSKLELDHVDPSTKIGHTVWSWAEQRRHAELAKCVARCRPCHIEKSKKEMRKGEQHGQAKLTEQEALNILHSDLSTTKLMEFYGVARNTINDIRAGRSWKHLRV